MNGWFGYVLFRVVQSIVLLLPLHVARRAARLAGVVVFQIFPIRKKATKEHLRLAFPNADERFVHQTARAAYVNLMTMLFELMWTPRLSDDTLRDIIHISNPELFESAHRRGGGVVLLSGHMGNWEWLSIGAARALGAPFNVIIHPIHNKRIDALVESYRTAFGNSVTPMGVAVRDIVRTLRNRGVVALLADQSAPRNALFVPFFGRYASTYEGPAAFALKTGAALLMGLAIRTADGNYHVELEEIPTGDLRGGTDENIRELTRRHVRMLEECIRQRPGDWLWQHRRWKHVPSSDSVLVQDDG